MHTVAPPHGPALPLDASSLPRALQYELWQRVVDRLNSGESLISTAHFQRAMEAEYLALTHLPPSELTRARIRRMIVSVNQRHPEVYVANGVRNGITRAFHLGTSVLRWSLADVRERGTRTISRFLRGSIRNYLESLGVHVPMIDPLSCVLATEQKMREEHERRFGSLPGSGRAHGVPVHASGPDAVPSAGRGGSPIGNRVADGPMSTDLGPEAQAAVEQGYLGQEEACRRSADQERLQGEITSQESARIPRNLDSYADLGILTAQEARNLRTIYGGKTKLRKAKVEHVRERLEAKLRPSIDRVASHLAVFAALQRIPAERDDVLRFLIRHQAVVTATDWQVDLTPAVESLAHSPSLRRNALAIVDRTDEEIRAMSLRLAPYGEFVELSDQPGRLMIDEGFIDQLRGLSLEQVSAILNSPNTQTRGRLTAAMRGLILLVDHLTRLTPFCQEVRVLRIAHTVEDLYHSAPDDRAGREQMDRFLRRRLGYLYPDLTPHEEARIEERLAELAQPPDHEPPSAPVAPVAPRVGGGLKLEADEMDLGVHLARVAIRSAGSSKRVLYKIMEDPDGSGDYIIVQRDPASADIVPARRHGAKRYVEKDRDGFWRIR